MNTACRSLRENWLLKATSHSARDRSCLPTRAATDSRRARPSAPPAAPSRTASASAYDAPADDRVQLPDSTPAPCTPPDALDRRPFRERFVATLDTAQNRKRQSTSPPIDIACRPIDPVMGIRSRRTSRRSFPLSRHHPDLARSFNRRDRHPPRVHISSTYRPPSAARASTALSTRLGPEPYCHAN